MTDLPIIMSAPTAAELREAREREVKAERDRLAVGTIWRVNDSRPDSARLVKVTQCHRHSEYVRISSIDEDGNLGTRQTFVRRDRFGGTKRGNYAFVRSETIG